MLHIIFLSLLLLGCHSDKVDSEQIPNRLALLGFEGVCDRSFYNYTFSEIDGKEVYTFLSDSDDFLEWLFCLEIFLKLEGHCDDFCLDEIQKEVFRETINDNNMDRVILISGSYYDRPRKRSLSVLMISNIVSEGVIEVEISVSISL